MSQTDQKLVEGPIQGCSGGILFFFHLLQDLELLLPLLHKAQAQGAKVLALLHFESDIKYPAMAARFREENLPWAIYDERIRWEWYRWLKPVRALVTASDCNVHSHRRGYRFVKKAKWLGIPTFTLQHGLENLGLNYADEEFPLNRVRFASRHVLTWGGAKGLLPTVSWRTKRKTTAVGVLKELPSRAKFTVDEKLITVFENLHWGRYSDIYRAAFLKSLSEIAQTFMDARIVLKPHQAGRWLTHRYQGPWKAPQNVEILDPLRRDLPSAAEWIARSSLVVTTPSTIALDAALMDTPVAVLGFDLSLPRYQPLPVIKNTQDWIGLIEKVRNQSYPMQVLQDFVDANASGRKGLDVATEFILTHS